ncbi:hypothetical protein [Cohnella zeiphila]|uniref:Uncharacterized protein n=1 Tax=Cohnella zeiphila TaxID=2761120 RepID=A0A7X0SKC1_9BACL|nr:hypothetical protein [Cohnella zeiphila]MBB6731456.1 hypothetical protein [Cohnella zeiphila]
MTEWRRNVHGDIHAMGNGRLLAYARGADIVRVFGPPYSSPAMAEASWSAAGAAEPLAFESRRLCGTNIWQSRIPGGAAEWEMFVSPALNVYAVRARADMPLRLELRLPKRFECCPLAGVGTADADAAYLIVSPIDARVYTYPSGERTYLAVLGRGVVSASVSEDRLTLEFAPGEMELRLVGGSSYPDLAGETEAAQRLSYGQLRESASASDALTASRLVLPDASRTPFADEGERIRELCESVAFLIKAQQSEDGGLMAGHNYQLAYVRDQYGTCRGLLALGLYEEARRNLEFRFSKWRHFGNLHNAESMGHHRNRHIHENDDVEQTAYTILQAFDYAEQSGDWATLERVFPMLDWCWRVQLPHLHRGMLPFNGDETYVAGGFLPRSALNDGSMEATLLFLEAGRRLLPPARSRGLWKPAEAEAYERVWKDTALRFRGNFWRENGFIANAPARALTADLPAFRHGVCEASPQEGFYFGWTMRTPENRYLSPARAASMKLPAMPGEPLRIHSAGLLPAFIGSSAVAAAERAAEARSALEQFERLGYLPSRPDSSRFVGYDIGLLLYNLTELGHPATADVLRHLLDIADTAGAWVEYYDEGRPMGTRCRPWESGVNIAAIAHAVRSAARREG